MIPAIPLEYMPPLMFAGLVVFMCFGYPVAFSLSAVGLFFGFFAIEWGYVIAFVFFIAVMFWRPQGILGGK